jgi:hypothetical protein
VVLEVPLLVQPISGTATYTAAQWRSMLDFLVSLDGVGTPGALKVSQRAAGANMSVDIAAGQWSVTGSSIANQGTYISRSTAVTNIAVAAAPGSGTRTDLICAQVKDDQSDGSGLQAQQLIAVTGTVGAGVPATPVNALALATIVIPAGKSSIVTADITDRRVGATALSGNKDYFKAYNASTVVTIVTATPTVINFDSAAWDVRLGFTFAGTSRYVCQQPGKFSIRGQVAFAAGATGVRQAGIRVNGVAAAVAGGQIPAAGVGTTVVGFNGDLQLNAGDYIEIYGYHTQGANLNLDNSGLGGTYLVVEWKGV